MRKAALPRQLLRRCRALRQQSTDAERLLWSLLRGRQVAGAKFRRQHRVGGYVLDFYCHARRLAVELDGGGHGQDAQRRSDQRRDQYLAGLGIRVLRFWNSDVFAHTEGVLATIYEAVVRGHECDADDP